jgi:hypothetical protein
MRQGFGVGMDGDEYFCVLEIGGGVLGRLNSNSFVLGGLTPSVGDADISPSRGEISLKLCASLLNGLREKNDLPP